MKPEFGLHAIADLQCEPIARSGASLAGTTGRRLRLQGHGDGLQPRLEAPDARL